MLVSLLHGLGDLDHAFSSVGAVNYLGAVFGVIFSGIFILHEKEHRTRYVIFFCGVFALIIALLLYRSLGTQDDDTNAKVLGYFADVMAIIMFGPPLMLMGDVIKTKNSEIIAGPMAISGQRSTLDDVRHYANGLLCARSERHQ
ncbi:hypothetical protein PI125_g12128 [Phytophthora idaei]|nr:hypothetical protein PI125_g12128 [Phytophthora idaei]KAG3151182.1 hypothetical protein PI126_g11126 [Phytophthora idaei]